MIDPPIVFMALLMLLAYHCLHALGSTIQITVTLECRVGVSSSYRYSIKELVSVVRIRQRQLRLQEATEATLNLSTGRQTLQSLTKKTFAMSSLGKRTEITAQSLPLPPTPAVKSILKKPTSKSGSLKRSTKRRPRPFSFPLPRSLNLRSLTQVSSDEKKKRKSVRFPSNILMQQAITVGDVQEMKQLISEHGSGVISKPDPSGLPPIMRCVFESQMAPLRLLVEAGADLAARDDENWTVLHVAASMDDEEAAKFILHHSKQCLTQIRNMDGERPIDLAESTDVARLLLEADLARNELETTSKAGQEELAILKLVHCHFERNRNIRDLNAVVQSSMSCDSLLHMAASENYPKLASYLLSHSLCELEAKDRRGWTPLHTATYHGSLDMVLLLIECGASVTSLTTNLEVAFDLTQNKLISTALREEENVQYL